MTNKKIIFSTSFDNTFSSMMDYISESLEVLNNVKKIDLADYNVCIAYFKCLYISPEIVGKYIDYLAKALSNQLLVPVVSDLNKFTIAYTKNNIELLTDKITDMISPSIHYKDRVVNNDLSLIFDGSKNQTLKDILVAYENQYDEHMVVSKEDLVTFINSDCFKNIMKQINDISYVATMKNIVKALPDILASQFNENYNQSTIECFRIFIEEFILFSAAIFNQTLMNLVSCIVPVSTYKSNISKTEEPIMECCLLKTNDFVLRNQMPFDINMRNVILKESSSDFRDTESALTYILKDPRSPISRLLHDNVDTSYGEGRYDSTIESLISKYSQNYYDKYGSSVDTGTHNNDPFTSRMSYCSDNLSWLNSITYNDSFNDSNYRKDAVGNNKSDSISNTLSLIYTMYSCEANDNKSLANNILKIYSAMINAIRCIKMNNNSNRISYDFVRDILITLGECFTRSVLKLYNNNTTILDYSDSMKDTMIPGYTHMESFIMEADEPQAPTPTVTPGNNPTNNNTPQKALSGLKQNMADIMRKFRDWVINKFSQFSSNFTKNHEAEVKWINANKALNDTISKSLTDGMFKPNLSNYPQFEIPAKELINPRTSMTTIVEKYIDSKDTIDSKIIKSMIYPGGDVIAKQIANSKDKETEILSITNYLLYKQLTPKPPYSGKLTPEMWKDLINDLTGTGRLIESEVKTISNDLKRAMEILQNRIRQDNVEAERLAKEANKPEQQQQPNSTQQEKPKSRAEELFTLVQEIAANYYTTIQNVLMRKFYAINYKVYTDIIKVYKQQTASDNVGSQPQQSQQQQIGGNTNAK